MRFHDDHKLLARLAGAAALGVASSFALVGCEEDAGDHAEDIGEEVEDAADDAADEVEDTVDDAIDETEDAVDDATDDGP